jgi:hypothetical protein
MDGRQRLESFHDTMARHLRVTKNRQQRWFFIFTIHSTPQTPTDCINIFLKGIKQENHVFLEFFREQASCSTKHPALLTIKLSTSIRNEVTEFSTLIWDINQKNIDFSSVKHPLPCKKI